MGALLVVSLAANLVLGVLLVVRLVRPDDRLEAAELYAAIDYASQELPLFEGMAFLRLLPLIRLLDPERLEQRFPTWRDYRDRHMAISQDLTV